MERNEEVRLQRGSGGRGGLGMNETHGDHLHHHDSHLRDMCGVVEAGGFNVAQFNVSVQIIGISGSGSGFDSHSIFFLSYFNYWKVFFFFVPHTLRPCDVDINFCFSGL